MLNYKANSLSTVVPSNIYEAYPKFREIMEAYYEWQLKTTVELKGVTGNIELSNKVDSISSELTRNIEAVVSTKENQESVLVEFDDKDTFIKDESVWFYNDIDTPLVFSLDNYGNYQVNSQLKNVITLFRGFEYKIDNQLDTNLYIKSARTLGPNDAFGLVTNNGADTGELRFTVTNEFPDFLYFANSINNSIGIIRILDVPTEFIPTTTSFRESRSPIAFARVRRMKFHPEYVYNNMDILKDINSPNALFLRYLEGFDLQQFYRNNFRFRSFFRNFAEFYKLRGTEAGIKFFFQNFFDSRVSIDYPSERVLRSSDSDYFIYDVLYVRVTYGEEITKNKTLFGKLSKARAIIEAYRYYAVRDYYKIFIRSEKTVNSFIKGEEVAMLDDQDSSIVYDLQGTLLGTVERTEITEPGNEFTVGSEITDTYNLNGVFITITFEITSISSTGIEKLKINNGGSGYAIGEYIYFSKPEKKTAFSAIIQENTGGDSIYQSNNIRVNIEDFSSYEPIDFTNSEFNYRGTKYSVTGISGSSNPYTLTVQSQTTPLVTPIVRSGEPIELQFARVDVTDPFYDSAGTLFTSSNNEPKIGAYAEITNVTASGTITEVEIRQAGDGYIKRPDTDDGTIQLVTVSGAGADIEVTGQGFGSIQSFDIVTDVVDMEFDNQISIASLNGNTDDDAVVQLKTGVIGQYGKYFKTNKGFISDANYIHDSFFYQDYSYVIQSDLNFNEFADLLRELAHPAGMIFFNQFFITRVFRQKINGGSDFPETYKTIYISLRPNGILNYNDFSFVDIIQGIVNIFVAQLQNEYYWSSTTITELEEYTSTSGITLSGYETTTLKTFTPLPRDTSEVYMDSRIYASTVDDIAGTGTLSYSDTTASGEPWSDIQTVTGTGTAFFDEISYGDLITVSGEQLYVQNILSDTELQAFRINNTSGPFSVSDSSYSVNINRRTELWNARFIDIIHHGDIITISGYADQTFKNFRNKTYVT